MPELPEVEFARQCLSRWLVGRKITGVECSPSRVLRGRSERKLRDLAGRVVRKIDRRGKWLLWHFAGGRGLASHLGMTGKFELVPPGAPPVRWSRARFLRADGAIVHFIDPRRFGELRVGALDDLRAGLSELGPDALGLGRRRLAALLADRTGTIKTVLMDQNVLAGLGNIYSTEALFTAGIHPARRAGTLHPAEIARLGSAIDESLRRMLAMNSGDKIVYVGESKRTNPFLVYGRVGTPCPRCEATLAKITLGGRTCSFCPSCQPRARKER
jgi:formamidopyrimidine-DNA glycosylase